MGGRGTRGEEEKGKSEVGVGGWARDIVVGLPAVSKRAGRGNRAWGRAMLPEYSPATAVLRAARKDPQPRTGPWIQALSTELRSAASIGASGISCQGEGYNEECRHCRRTALDKEGASRFFGGQRALAEVHRTPVLQYLALLHPHPSMIRSSPQHLHSSVAGGVGARNTVQ